MLILKVFFLFITYISVSEATFYWCFGKITDLFEPTNQGAFVGKDEACSHLVLQPASELRFNSIKSLLSNTKVERDTANRHCL